MRILVISDSHDFVLDEQVEKINKFGTFKMLIHCGDKYNDGLEFGKKLKIENIIQVPGNCDYGSDKAPVRIELVEGKKLLITHGHLYKVKSDLNELLIHGKEVKAHAVIYGHTHCAQNEIIDDILFFNPGSTIFPKAGKESFGILEVTKEKVWGQIISLEK